MKTSESTNRRRFLQSLSVADYSEGLSRPLSNMVSEQRAPLHLEKGETLQLDIFLDRSIIEVFANGRQVVTQVVYPELEGSTGVKVFSGKEAVTVKNIQSWTMAQTKPIKLKLELTK